MIPNFGRIFGEPIPAYFTLLTLGFITATLLCARWAKRNALDHEVIIDLGLIAVLAGVAGARVLHVIADGYFWDYVHLCTDPSKVDWKIGQDECARLRTSDWGWLKELVGAAPEPRFPRGTWDAAHGVCHPTTTDCWAWARFWAGGLTYYGGFIGASLMAVYLLRRDRFPFWKAADMAGFAVPLGLGFGRMGCLLAGCCFGLRTEGGLGMSFPPHSPASESQFKAGDLASASDWSHKVLPTQIFESALSLGIAAFCLLYMHGRKRYDGQVFTSFLALYALGRFVLEFFRADDRGGLANLSTSQLIGIALVALAAAIHVRRSRPGPIAAAA